MKPVQCVLLLTLFAFLASCQNNGKENDIEGIRSLNDSTSITGLTGDSVKLVKTAAINFKVNDVSQSTRAVSGLAHKYGGMLTLQNMEAAEQQRKELQLSNDSLLIITATTPQTAITARIPSSNLAAFLFEVSDLGYYTGSSKMQVEDKSLAYLQNILMQKNRANALGQVSSGKAKRPTTYQAVAISDEAIAQQIENRTIDAEVNYSTVDLMLFQNPVVRREIIANTNLEDYQLPYAQRFGNALVNGWDYFLNFLVAIAHLWMFILVGVVTFFAYRYWQKRRVAMYKLKTQ